MSDPVFVLDLPTTTTDARGPHVDIVLPSLTVDATVVSTAPVAEPSQVVGVVLELDPACILVSGSPNRLDESFDTEDFETLRLSIASAKRNSQPILVAPLGGKPEIYELVAGERRLRACAIEKIKVRAIVVAPGTSERDWVIERIRENMGREDPRPYEMAQQLKCASQLLKPRNLTEFAAQVGISLSKVSRLMDLAAVPDEVTAAFSSRRDIRVSDIKPLKDLCDGDLDAVGREVAAIRSSPTPVTAAKVVERLREAATSTKAERTAEKLAPCKPRPFEAEPQPLTCHGQPAGNWMKPVHGPLIVQIDVAMSDRQRDDFIAVAVNHLERKVLPKPKGKSRAAPGALPSVGADGEPAEKVMLQPAVMPA